MSDMSAALAAFDKYCREHDEKPSDARRLVFKILLEVQKPLGAYDILERMGKTMPNPKPPTAYRAIEFLQKHGFVHRIESLNAYAVCKAGHSHRGSQFMICDSCGDVQEMHLCSVPEPLNSKVSNKNFKISFWNAELHGICDSCQKTNS